MGEVVGEVGGVGGGVGGRWEVGGRWVAPNRIAPTSTPPKETASNANRTEPNRNTQSNLGTILTAGFRKFMV